MYERYQRGRQDSECVMFCSESDRVMRRDDRMMGGSEAEAYIEAQRK